MAGNMTKASSRIFKRGRTGKQKGGLLDAVEQSAAFRFAESTYSKKSDILPQMTFNFGADRGNFAR